MTASTVTSSTRYRAIGWLAAAGTLPYVVLKVLWLAGSTVGTTEGAFLADPTIQVLNGVTLAMDLVVVALALALTHRWGDRLPAWLVLLPMWVGTGFLVPIAVAIVPGTVAMISIGTSTGPLEPWVQPVVYGGFAWQGIFLCAAFAVHTGRRWGTAIAATDPPARTPLLRTVAAGGAVMAGISALLHLMVGVIEGDPVGLVVKAISAGLAAAGAVGVLALARGTARRWTAAIAAWAGSAAMFSWGLYSMVTAVAVSAFAGGSPADGLAQLTGLLGGFALAVASLLALVPERTG